MSALRRFFGDTILFNAWSESSLHAQTWEMFFTEKMIKN
jgi:hypothetical protein